MNIDDSKILNEISEKFLNDQYEIIKSKSYNFKKMTMNYWKNIILNDDK